MRLFATKEWRSTRWAKACEVMTCLMSKEQPNGKPYRYRDRKRQECRSEAG